MENGEFLTCRGICQTFETHTTYDYWGDDKPKRKVMNTEHSQESFERGGLQRNWEFERHVQAHEHMNIAVKEWAVTHWLRDYADDKEVKFIDYFKKQGASRDDSRRISRCVVKSYENIENNLPDAVLRTRSGSEFWIRKRTGAIFVVSALASFQNESSNMKVF